MTEDEREMVINMLISPDKRDFELVRSILEQAITDSWEDAEILRKMFKKARKCTHGMVYYDKRWSWVYGLSEALKRLQWHDIDIETVKVLYFKYDI